MIERDLIAARRVEHGFIKSGHPPSPMNRILLLDRSRAPVVISSDRILRSLARRGRFFNIRCIFKVTRTSSQTNNHASQKTRFPEAAGPKPVSE